MGRKKTTFVRISPHEKKALFCAISAFSWPLDFHTQLGNHHQQTSETLRLRNCKPPPVHYPRPYQSQISVCSPALRVYSVSCSVSTNLSGINYSWGDIGLGGELSFNALSKHMFSAGKIYRIRMTAASGNSGLRAAFSYCVQQVRNYDYHHYLCLLELPPDMRRAAFALRAFNVETARAMDVASDPKIGLMRLLWWQEAIDKIFSNKLIEHPVAQALGSVLVEHKMSKAWLKRSVEARINDAKRETTDIPETIEELERYAEDTASTILYATLQAGGVLSTTADHAASHIGKASGLLLLLKSLPYHASRNCHYSYIPTKVAEKTGLLVKEGGRSEIHLDSRENLCNAVFEMASVANAHLQKARNLSATVPQEAYPALLPAVPAQVILDSLSRVQFDVFDPRLTRGVLGIPPLWFQLKLKWHSWRGKY